jgi:GNAT superfamily N-acetyltransferase
LRRPSGVKNMAVASKNLLIRPATSEDVPLILDLIRGIAEYEKLSHEVVATEDLLREHLFGPRPAAEVLLAYVDGNSVGFALYFPNFSTFLGRPGVYLEDLYVRPEMRGKGVGKALLREVARVAARRNGGRLEWSVLDWNEPAIKFYKSLGAVPMDEWTVHRVTGDALRKLADL